MKSSSSSSSSFSRHLQSRWPTSRPLQLSTLILEYFEHLIRDPNSRKTWFHWKTTHNPQPRITIQNSHEDLPPPGIPSSPKNQSQNKVQESARQEEMVQATSLRKFTKFGELPAELRNEIWKLSLPGPQVISIRRTPKKRDIASELFPSLPAPGTTKNMKGKGKLLFQTSTSIAQLQACRDSRGIALERYSQRFGERLQYPVYFDASQDWVFISMDDIDTFSCKFREEEIAFPVRDIVERIAIMPTSAINQKIQQGKIMDYDCRRFCARIINQFLPKIQKLGFTQMNTRFFGEELNCVNENIQRRQFKNEMLRVELLPQKERNGLPLGPQRLHSSYNKDCKTCTSIRAESFNIKEVEISSWVRGGEEGFNVGSDGRRWAVQGKVRINDIGMEQSIIVCDSIFAWKSPKYVSLMCLKILRVSILSAQPSKRLYLANTS